MKHHDDKVMPPRSSISPNHFQKSLNPGFELSHRPCRIDIFQMKKGDLDRLVVGLSRGNLEAKGIAVFVNVQNSTIHFELLGIRSNISEPRGHISFKGPCLVSSVCLGPIDLPQMPIGEGSEGISSNVSTRKRVSCSVAEGIGNDVTSEFFHELDQLDVIET